MWQRALSGSGGGGNGFRGSINPSSTWAYVDCGFEPSDVLYWTIYGSTAVIYEYDVSNGKVYRWYTTGAKIDVTNSMLNIYIKVDGSKIYFTRTTDTGFSTAVEIMAIK